MRSPWIDLLFLHGHVTHQTLAWLPDTPSGAESSRQIEVDVAPLPLADRGDTESTCRA